MPVVNVSKQIFGSNGPTFKASGDLQPGQEKLELSGELKGGKALQDLAQEWNSAIEDLGFVGRNQAEVDAAIRNRAFVMPKPDQGPVFDGLAVGNGEYVIVELSALLSNDANSDEQALNGLTLAIGQSEYQASVDLLSKRAEVTRTPLEDLQ